MRIARNDVPRATESLAAAFYDYPLLVHGAPDPERRRRLARAFCAAALYYGVRWGEVYATSPQLEGVAVWVPGKHFPMTMAKALCAVPLAAFLSLGRHGGSRLRPAAAHLDAMHRRLAPPGHTFLFVLGVRPEFRGQGHAGRLLRPILEQHDRENQPCYVDTMNPAAVPLYEHLGFRIRETSAIPKSDLTAWALLREPSPL